jgi:predicted nuclease of predicted toxin-antitoxin system
MRFLANENFPLDAVSALRQSGHDVLWIRTDAPGSRDEEVLARAVSEERILLTFDKDFGELAFRSKLPASCGIILFRVAGPNSEYIAHLVISVMQTETDWTGHFAVVEKERIRVRSLPGEY